MNSCLLGFSMYHTSRWFWRSGIIIITSGSSDSSEKWSSSLSHLLPYLVSFHCQTSVFSSSSSVFIIKCDRACENQPCECRKFANFFPCLLYHNLQSIYTNEIKPLSLLQNLMGFLLEFTERAYHIQN